MGTSDSKCEQICIDSTATIADYQNTCAVYDMDVDELESKYEEILRACIGLMCNNKFLDGFDSCVACMVTTGEVLPEDASMIAQEYTTVREYCIDEGFDVGATSTADSSNNEAAAGGSTTDIEDPIVTDEDTSTTTETRTPTPTPSSALPSASAAATKVTSTSSASASNSASPSAKAGDVSPAAETSVRLLKSGDS